MSVPWNFNGDSGGVTYADYLPRPRDMSAEAFNAVMKAEIRGAMSEVAESLWDRLAIEQMRRRSFYWWQRLALRLGLAWS